MTDRPTDDPYTDMLALAGWEDVPHLRDKYLNDPAFYNALNLTAQLAARIRELEVLGNALAAAIRNTDTGYGDLVVEVALDAWENR